MEIELVMNADLKVMSDGELDAAYWTLRRLRLERAIEARYPYPPLPWIAALDAMDGDPDLEDGADWERLDDREEQDEDGDEADLEPDLSLTEHIDQERRTRTDPFCNAVLDGEENAMGDIRGAYFDGQGVRAAREMIRQAQCKAGYWARRRALRMGCPS